MQVLIFFSLDRSVWEGFGSSRKWVEPELVVLWLHLLYFFAGKAVFTILTCYKVEPLHLQNVW